jgi:hypothetical protein
MSAVTKKEVHMITDRLRWISQQENGITLQHFNEFCKALPDIIRKLNFVLECMTTGIDVEAGNELSPWQIDRVTIRAWGEGSAVRHAAMAAFYKQVTLDIFRLEPRVDSRNLPAELVDCYTGVGVAGESRQESTTWLLRIDHVPPALRDCYPRLRVKRNMTEYDQLPAWQQPLYEWSARHGQYRLSEAHAAWCPGED